MIHIIDRPRRGLAAFVARSALMLRHRRAHLALVLISALLFAACSPSNSGGSTGSGSTSGSNGVVSFALQSSTPSSIASFTVDVTDIRIGKLGGANTSVLPRSVTIDLAQTNEIARLLQSASLGSDTYDLAEITLDFTHSNVLTRSGPATLVDGNGNPFTAPFTISIELNEMAFPLASGEQRLLVFDVDVASATNVDLPHDMVAADPMVRVEVDRTGTPLEVVAELGSIATAMHEVGVALEGNGGTEGNVALAIDAHTVFQVDGAPAAGTTGLAALALKPNGTPIQATVEIDPHSPKLLASVVLAGLGTDASNTDIVDGEVIDRLGNPSAGSNVTLAVRGSSRNSLGTLTQSDAAFTAVVNFANTHVVREGSPLALDTDELNVGQRVRVFGTLNGGVIFANLGTNLVREEPVHVLGQAISASSSSGGPTTLTMSLEQVESLPQQVFVWLDSGLTPPNPAAFTVNADELVAAEQVTSGESIEALGFCAPVPDAAQDFIATSLTNTATSPTQLIVTDKPNGFTLTIDASSARITLTITGTAGAGEKAILEQHLAGAIPLPTTPAPTIIPANALGNYSLMDTSTASVQSFTSFDTFTSALNAALSHGAKLGTFSAEGVYTPSTNFMRATVISATVE
jgi:hypothetical protein